MYQLRLLDALLSLPADTFNFVSLPGRRVVTVDDVVNASPTIKTLAANVQGHTWNSLDLFETLVALGDSENSEIRSCVREMLDKAVKISAELVHMGLLQVSVRIWYLFPSPSNSYVPETLEYNAEGVFCSSTEHVFSRSAEPSACFHAHLADRSFISHEFISRLL